MKCPYCDSNELRILETRESPNNMTRRRRQCELCGRRVTTYEYIEKIELMVRKKDGRIERFDSDKIIKGLQKAGEKRPISLVQMKNLAEKVRQDIIEEDKELVNTSEIGDKIMLYLKELDWVTYVRFASVYKEFKEPKDFNEVLKEMEKN